MSVAKFPKPGFYMAAAYLQKLFSGIDLEKGLKLTIESFKKDLA